MPTSTTTIDPKLLDNVKRPAYEDGKLKTTTRKVRRDGERVEEEVPVMRKVEAEEVFSYAVRGDQVVVVTTDGHKYRGPLPKSYTPPAPAGQGENGGGDPDAGS